jgi:hypothetical protein
MKSKLLATGRPWMRPLLVSKAVLILSIPMWESVVQHMVLQSGPQLLFVGNKINGHLSLLQ